MIMKTLLHTLGTLLFMVLFTSSCENRQKSMPDKQFVADMIIYGVTSSAVIGELARNFYHRLYLHYQDSTARSCLLNVKVLTTKDTIRVPSGGNYHVWARTTDWAPGNWSPPGQFNIWMEGRNSPKPWGTLVDGAGTMPGR